MQLCENIPFPVELSLSTVTPMTSHMCHKFSGILAMFCTLLTQRDLLVFIIWAE